MKHIVFIINPKSGVDRKKAISRIIEISLNRDMYSFEIQYTRYEKHGIELAEKAAQQGAYAVVVVGGDGSVNDAIHGLVHQDVIMGVIPKGSGNGLARTLGIPLSVKKAIHIINRGNIHEVDVAYANEHIFLSNAGVGFDALVIKKFKKTKRRGFVSYCQYITKYIWGYRAKDWKININGKTFYEKAFMVNVANGVQLGYDFSIAPQARYDDELLDVTIIQKFPTLLAVLLAWRMKRRTIHKSKYVKAFQAAKLDISAPHLHIMQTDGDAHRTENNIHFRIAGKQKFFVP